MWSQFAQLDITPLEKAARWTEADHQQSIPDSQALRPVWGLKEAGEVADTSSVMEQKSW